MFGGLGLQAALIRFSIRFRGVVIALACVLLGYGIYMLLQAKYDVFPEFALPQVGIQTEAPGLAPEQVEILVTQPLENTINGVPGLRALRSSSIQGLSVVTATFDPSSDVYRDRHIVAERLTEAYTFLSERIDETLSGYTAPVVVNIFGNDLDLLDREAQEVAKVLGAIPRAADVTIQSPPGMPQLTIRLRKGDLDRWAIDPVDALDAIRTAYQGDTVGQIFEGNRVFPVIVILDPASRAGLEQVSDLPLRTASGSYVRLRQIADIYESSGRYQVLHQRAQRLQTITANVAGRDLTSFVKDARAQIAKNVSLSAGTYLEFAGEAEAQSRSLRDLLVNSIIAVIGIVLLLSIVTRNANNLLLVLANLPFAFVGAVLAVFASGGLLSLGSMVGFVALLGITLRNSILMIAHYEHLVGVEGQSWSLQTAIEGAADRLAPILMTSLVTALGVLPLAIGMNEPGREIEGPMALVILGGLLTSLALNLLLLPALALRYGRFEPFDIRDQLGEPLESGARPASLPAE